MWLLLVVYRGVFDASDQVSRVALALLTVGVLTVAVIGIADFVESKMRAKRHGERLFTSSVVSSLLVFALIGGFLLRFVVGGDEPGGVVAWTGGAIGVLAIAGLVVLGFLRERARAKNPSFYFDPNWKYGLISVCFAAMVVFAVTDAEGVAASASVLFFWLALILLAIQTAGRWILIWRRRSQDSGAAVR